MLNLRFAFFFFLFILSASAAHTQEKWTNMLDKDLSKWELYLSFEHKNDYNGQTPVNQNGDPLEPVGYNKNVKQVFSVAGEKGEAVLRISGEIYGCIFTREIFENYHLKLKVKWGVPKWEPRLDKLKDSGILYHSVGKCGVDYWKSWMLSQEFQIMEGHMGDYWTIANAAIDIRAFIPEGTMNPVASQKQPFIPFGGQSANGGFCMRSADYESPAGDWTQLELICFEGKSIHIVNGHIVMVLQNSRYTENGKSFPLTKGKIQLQSEAAEVFFKDIHIKKLDTLPEDMAKLF
ncbi:MAG: DUF1080 domain-containing protein [Bacteroidetes bacterium]|nr:DUF1080 domain-containing protein [Bacteroidota bacterium]